jgi:hypothetical protein
MTGLVVDGIGSVGIAVGVGWISVGVGDLVALFFDAMRWSFKTFFKTSKLQNFKTSKLQNFKTSKQ